MAETALKPDPQEHHDEGVAASRLSVHPQAGPPPEKAPTAPWGPLPPIQWPKGTDDDDHQSSPVLVAAVDAEGIYLCRMPGCRPALMLVREKPLVGPPRPGEAVTPWTLQQLDWNPDEVTNGDEFFLGLDRDHLPPDYPVPILRFEMWPVGDDDDSDADALDGEITSPIQHAGWMRFDAVVALWDRCIDDDDSDMEAEMEAFPHHEARAPEME